MKMKQNFPSEKFLWDMM